MRDLTALRATMPHKIKVQTASQYGCNCVAYVDARQVQDKLDDVVGAENWQTKYEAIDGQLFCHLGIYNEDTHEWVWKSDTGTESMAEKEKGQVSDAFKRAAVQWGIGRFLYSLGIKKTKSTKNNKGKYVPSATEGGKQIWDLTAHFKADKATPTPARPTPASVSAQAPASAPVNVNKTDSTTPNGRYDQSKGGDAVVYTKTSINADTMKRIGALSRDGKTGKTVLLDYIDGYNEKNGTTHVAADLTSDSIINSIIDFIDNVPPKTI